MSKSNISTKKLKAIVFTDIVDFTKLSAEDEQKALEVIDRQRDLLKPIVLEHKGEWLKEIGDGLLFSFDSSLDAVRCSIKIQQALQDVDDFKIRIGIHQGDIFIKDGDVYGDDVNIASRVEGFAPIGGISISDKISKDIASVKDIKTSFIGYKNLKGVEQETQIKNITSHNLPSYSKISFPIFASYFCFFASISLFLSIFLPPLLLYGIEFHSIEEIFKEYYYWCFKTKRLLVSFTYLFIGYSSLSYSRGLSIYSQKLLNYLAYGYIMFPLVRRIADGRLLESQPMFIFIILLYIVAPILYIFFSFYKNNLPK